MWRKDGGVGSLPNGEAKFNSKLISRKRSAGSGQDWRQSRKSSKRVRLVVVGCFFEPVDRQSSEGTFSTGELVEYSGFLNASLDK